MNGYGRDVLKLSRPKFEFSWKVKGLNPGYLLKYFLLYQDYEDSDRMDRYGRDGVNHLFRDPLLICT